MTRCHDNAVATLLASARVLLLLLLVPPSQQSPVQQSAQHVIDNRDPCQHITCGVGRTCHVHTVTCQHPPCARVGECVPANCTLACGADSRCQWHTEQQQNGQQLVARCETMSDACGGVCSPQHEECLSFVRPCPQPPCPPVHRQCVPRSFVPRARNAAAAAESISLPARQTRAIDSTPCPVACRPHEHCHTTLTRCTTPPCPLISRCVAQPVVRRTPSTTSVCAGVTCPTGQHCVPTPCGGGGEMCGGCVPRHVNVTADGRPQPYCPVDDLSPLVAPGGCGGGLLLDTCTSHAQCGDEGQDKLCCRRGCGRTCVPACTRACRPPSEQCQLVEMTCRRPPCPHRPQCVFIRQDNNNNNQNSPLPPQLPHRDDNTKTSAGQQHGDPLTPSRPATVAAPAFSSTTSVPSTTTVKIIANTEANNVHHFPAPPLPSLEDALAPPLPAFAIGDRCGSVRCAIDHVCRLEWCSRPGGCAGPRHPHSTVTSQQQTARPPSPRLYCVPRVPRRPGMCPLNEQAAGKCFAARVQDSCSSDYDCSSDQRCCRHGCARRCMPVCRQCEATRQVCRLLTSLSPDPFCYNLPAEVAANPRNL